MPQNDKDPDKKKKSSKSDIFSRAIEEELHGSSTSKFLGNMSDDKEKSGSRKSEKDETFTVNKRTLPPSEIKYENVSSKWLALGGIVLVLALLIIGYFILFPRDMGPAIYLSANRIEEADLYTLSKRPMVFPKEKPVYFYFHTGGRLGVKKINISIFEQFNKNNKIDLVLIGQFEESVQLNWRKSDRYFQREYFEHPGSYLLRVSAPDGKVLSEKSFNIK